MANPVDRRGFLANGSLLGAAGALGLLATRSAASAEPWPAGTGPILTGKAPSDAQPRSGGMPLARYLQYVNWFNNGDPRYLEFYHPDVELELGNATIRSSSGIRDFYREVHAHIHEKVEVTHYVADATGIAAELPSEFKVYKDWAEPNYFRRPLKAGEVFRVISLGMYQVDNGRFRHIKAARYKLVHEWRMEG
ncbi:MAG: nuclear transport factor 2 family protein [Proteobacteria bacterium]|nr:nuclear transport factor 2 family protein [Pseudomonadota bacterium]